VHTAVSPAISVYNTAMSQMDTDHTVLVRKRRAPPPPPSSQCCHCGLRKDRRLSYDERREGRLNLSTKLPTRPVSLYVDSDLTQGKSWTRLGDEPVYEELVICDKEPGPISSSRKGVPAPSSPSSAPMSSTMQTLDVRLRESKQELLERGGRDFQSSDSGLESSESSEGGSLGRLSMDSSHVEAGEEFYYFDEKSTTPVKTRTGKHETQQEIQGKVGLLARARRCLHRVYRLF